MTAPLQQNVLLIGIIAVTPHTFTSVIYWSLVLLFDIKWRLRGLLHIFRLGPQSVCNQSWCLDFCGDLSLFIEELARRWELRLLGSSSVSICLFQLSNNEFLDVSVRLWSVGGCGCCSNPEIDFCLIYSCVWWDAISGLFPWIASFSTFHICTKQASHYFPIISECSQLSLHLSSGELRMVSYFVGRRHWQRLERLKNSYLSFFCIARQTLALSTN